LEDKLSKISQIYAIDDVAVLKEEKEQKKLQKERQREINLERERILNEQKDRELKERMTRVYEKVGRVTVPRSEKPRIKREVKVVKIDQETLDRQRYLGEEIPVQ
jgi:hypothetical protein